MKKELIASKISYYQLVRVRLKVRYKECEIVIVLSRGLNEMWRTTIEARPREEDNSNEEIYPTVSANHFASSPLANDTEEIKTDH
jgi:hypothetical protein